MANEKIMTLSMLTYYDGKIKSWVTTELDEAIAGLGNVFTLKGTVADIASLPADGNETGDIYLVGTTAPFDEYYWDGSKWELMGTTATDISGCVTKEALYEGADGTGTVAAPADGTIIKSIYDKIAAVQAEVDAAEEKIAANEAAIAENKAAVEKAQDEVDALETLVGVIPEGATAATVVDYAKELVDAIEDYDDTEVRGLISDNAEAIAKNAEDIGKNTEAIAAVKETADGAVQEVTAGTANGTIAVDGTDVAVTGLGGAAYKAEDYYEVAGAAQTAASAAQTAAQEYADGLNTAMDSRVEALETATSNTVTPEDIDSLFAGTGV
ncbi:MAG: hypothetical protein IJZ47_08020 [Oscillospiraceae bacterium]|nr:hypothetical protein [Oscillospiraceae bacterium]